jgi:hypothetical protein
MMQCIGTRTIWGIHTWIKQLLVLDNDTAFSHLCLFNGLVIQFNFSVLKPKLMYMEKNKYVLYWIYFCTFFKLGICKTYLDFR